MDDASFIILTTFKDLAEESSQLLSKAACGGNIASSVCPSHLISSFSSSFLSSKKLTNAEYSLVSSMLNNLQLAIILLYFLNGRYVAFINTRLH